MDIDLDAERWYTKDKRECLLHKKGGGVRIDGCAHIGCQERKLSEKSNSAWYQKISQFQQESHLWYLGEWASFYPSLPGLFLNRYLTDFPINHTSTIQTASMLEQRLVLLFNDVWTMNSTNSAANKCNSLANFTQAF